MKNTPSTGGPLQIVKGDVLATVLFCDLADYSQFAAGVTPMQLINRLNTCRALITDTVRENQGTVAKIVGDALFAYWLAEAHSDHASMAYRFASSIREKISGVSSGTTVRIGIHSGHIALVNITMGASPSLEPIGDVVNLASGLNEACRLYKAQALASDQVISHAAGISGWTNLGSAVIKGKSDPITLHGLI